MTRQLPEPVTRRVAIILGAGKSDLALLEVLRPLLGKDRQVDLRGVFVVDEELQHAAALPFAKELCQLTLNVQEFHSARLEHILASRTRIARKAISGFARRTGIPHSFQDVRGSTINMLQRMAQLADITVFGPLQPFASTPIAKSVTPSRSKRRIVVVVDDLSTGARALLAARLLAEGEEHRIVVLLLNATPEKRTALEQMISELLPPGPLPVRLLAEPGMSRLIRAVRELETGMLVIGTSESLLQTGSLRLLREQLRCPVCLVRRWDDSNTENQNP